MMTSSPTLLELSPVVKIDSINSPKTGRHYDYSGAVANSLISLKPATFLERLRHWYLTVNLVTEVPLARNFLKIRLIKVKKDRSTKKLRTFTSSLTS